MKKFLSFLMLMGTTVANAQNTFSYEFIDAEGNVVADGTTLTRSDAHEDASGLVQIPSGLNVKNVGAPANYYVRVVTTITQIDNGNLQVCFPINCFNYTVPGTYKSGEGKLSADESKDIQSEWFPETYGECVVTYQAMSLQPMANLFIEKGGPTVKVRYVYADAAKVADVQRKAETRGCYSLTGRRSTMSQRGVVVVRQADGTMRKKLNR